MADAAARSGRPADAVRLIAVSKTFPIESVREAYAAGQREFGENRVQEAVQKIGQAPDLDAAWHLIGHLQSNKARKAAEHCAAIHSVDSVDILTRVDVAAASAGRQIDVLIQADLAGESTKHGAPVGALPPVFEQAGRCKAARVVGLMLIPPIADDAENARVWFRQLREQRDRLLAGGVPADFLHELSMGMSHDFEVAIEEGATMIRVGSAIFGSRA
jgi:PLP dependent protein